MSIDGDMVGVTSVSRWSPQVSARVRMSFSLLATTSRSIGTPILWATKPANTSPKFPDGTEKETGTSGPPRATAAVT